MKYMKKMRNATDYFVKEKILNSVITQCKKTRKCFSCNAYNGVVKKLPGFPLKIIHDKFSDKKSDIEELIKDFEYSVSINKEIE